MHGDNHRDDVMAALLALPGVDRVWIMLKAEAFGYDVYVPGFTGDDAEITDRIFYVSDGPITVFRTPPPGVTA